MNNKEISTLGTLTLIGIFGGLILGSPFTYLGLALPIGYVITKKRYN